MPEDACYLRSVREKPRNAVKMTAQRLEVELFNFATFFSALNGSAAFDLLQNADGLVLAKLTFRHLFSVLLLLLF
jgi:hypothetical protein